jgi:murein DD-endopeptidase MepM/ murein hydrolase activator NlpD
MPYPPLRDPRRPLFFKRRHRIWQLLALLGLLAAALTAALSLMPRLPSPWTLPGLSRQTTGSHPLPEADLALVGNLFEQPPLSDGAGDSPSPDSHNPDGRTPASPHPDEETLSGAVRPGQTLAGILGRHADPGKIAALADPEDFSFSDLRSGQAYRLTLRDRELVSFEYDISPTEILVIDEAEGELSARVQTRQCEVRPALLTATITTSLSEAVSAAGGNAATAAALADIFASDMDFSRDVQPGDSLRAVVEERFVEGRPAGLGRVLAARYVSGENVLEGFGILGDRGKLDYYDAQGRPLRKAFLRAPLSFLRVTSGFTSSRLHPILKVRKAHYGVDYAAPTGTPVWTVGDGLVIERGRNHAAGNFVTIRHSKTHVTRYNHLSRFAKGLAQGSRVVQGQVIGYVGATGYATGPHLDFRMYANGRPVNALANDEAEATPLPRARLAEFREDALAYAAVLDGHKPPTALADALPPTKGGM